MEPTENFANAYEEVRSGAISSSSNPNFLTIWQKLTQVCCFPGLVIPNYMDNQDAKFKRLLSVLSEIAIVGRDKVIIFSTFTGSIRMLEAFISSQFGQNSIMTINGEVPAFDRKSIVDRFNQSQGFAVLIINPKSGGAGLNITGANHVIHFNRQWNPAVERQATARAYRRNQEKTVFVHLFFYSNTIEQVIDERLRGKELLSEAALEAALHEDEDIAKAKAMLISPVRLNIEREK